MYIFSRIVFRWLSRIFILSIHSLLFQYAVGFFFANYLWRPGFATLNPLSGRVHNIYFLGMGLGSSMNNRSDVKSKHKAPLWIFRRREQTQFVKLGKLLCMCLLPYSNWKRPNKFTTAHRPLCGLTILWKMGEPICGPRPQMRQVQVLIQVLIDNFFVWFWHGPAVQYR